MKLIPMPEPGDKLILTDGIEIFVSENIEDLVYCVDASDWQIPISLDGDYYTTNAIWDEAIKKWKEKE